MTESRIADIYDPLTGAWTPVALSGPPAPRERLPNNTLHLPDEERERIRRMHGEAMLADVEAVANGLLNGRDIPRERAEELERQRAGGGSQYTFPCSLAALEAASKPALAHLRRDLEELEKDLAGVGLRVDYNRSHAILRASRELTPEEVARFKAVFADFRERAGHPLGMTAAERARFDEHNAAALAPIPRVEHIRTNAGLRRVLERHIADEASIPREEIERWSADKLDAAEAALQGARLLTSAPAWRDELRARLGDDLDRLWPAPLAALSEGDARELTWLRDLFERAHLKPDLLSNTTGQRWAIVPVERVEGTEEYMDRKAAAEMREARARGLFAEPGPTSGPGDTHSPQPADIVVGKDDLVTVVELDGEGAAAVVRESVDAIGPAAELEPRFAASEVPSESVSSVAVPARRGGRGKRS